MPEHFLVRRPPDNVVDRFSDFWGDYTGHPWNAAVFSRSVPPASEVPPGASMGPLPSVPTGGASGVSFQAPTAWMPPLASMIPPLASMIPPEEATSQVDDPVYEPTDFSPVLLPTTHLIVADLDKIKKALLDGVGGTMQDVLGKITEVYVSGGMSVGEAREEAEATYNKLSLIHISEPTRPY